MLALAPVAASAGTLNVHPSIPHETRAEPSATPLPEHASLEIGGRSESEWRDASLAMQRALESAETTLSSCETREAPAPYRDIEGYLARGRRGPYWVEVKSCDDARIDVQDARREIADFEELARRQSVPPSWMR